MKQMDGRSLSANWGRAFRCLLLLSLLASLAATAVPRAEAAQRVHPALLQLAAKQPDAKVGVIVQKHAKNSSAESMVPKLGGTVTKNLSIINAFVAEMPAKAVPQLAKADGVRWVSPDAPVRNSAATSFTTWATEPGAYTTSSNTTSFNSTAISAGKYIWFNSQFKGSGVSSTVTTTLSYVNATVQFTANGSTYKLTLPDADITFTPNATTATTTFDTANNRWVTRAPLSLRSSEMFLTGMMFQVPVNLPGSISVTWSGSFTSSTSGVSVNPWKWSAAVYSTFSTDYNAIGVKPCNSSTLSQYRNSDYAGVPENFKTSIFSGARGTGGTNYTGTYSANVTATPTRVFANVGSMMDSPVGPNGTFASANNISQTFSGFAGEKTIGSSITRVEAVLHGYVLALPPTDRDIDLSVVVGGQLSADNDVALDAFSTHVGEANAGAIYVDLTNLRNWQWSDFDNNLGLVIDQTDYSISTYFYYDAIGLRVTSDVGTDTTGGTAATSEAGAPVDTGRLGNVYNKAVRATDVWNMSTRLQGQGVSVAVVDSGIVKTKDMAKVVGSVNCNSGSRSSNDGFGHGTFVAGIVAGNGKSSGGKYMGMAPKTNIINVRVSDDQGMGTESSVVEGLQWIFENKARHNIRVVNMSLNSGTPQSYHVSPMNAAVEMLWFSGIVVVVSAGNNGTSTLYAPANDPFVITVGATKDFGTVSLSDDTVASFSAYGVAENGTAKPDLVAPGTNIISLLPDNRRLTISRDSSRDANRVNEKYFRMSGTSMAAPVVAGAVALLLQDEPNLTPDQVKYRLMSTAVRDSRWPGYDPVRAGSGYLDVYAAVQGTTTQSANTDTPASRLLWTGDNPVNWNSVNWNSVNWNSVNWNSVNWNSVNWNSVNWNSDYWGP